MTHVTTPGDRNPRRAAGPVQHRPSGGRTPGRPEGRRRRPDTPLSPPASPAPRGPGLQFSSLRLRPPRPAHRLPKARRAAGRPRGPLPPFPGAAGSPPPRPARPPPLPPPLRRRPVRPAPGPRRGQRAALPPRPPGSHPSRRAAGPAPGGRRRAEVRGCHRRGSMAAGPRGRAHSRRHIPRPAPPPPPPPSGGCAPDPAAAAGVGRGGHGTGHDGRSRSVPAAAAATTGRPGREQNKPLGGRRAPAAAACQSQGADPPPPANPRRRATHPTAPLANGRAIGRARPPRRLAHHGGPFRSRASPAPPPATRRGQCTPHPERAANQGDGRLLGPAPSAGF